MAGYKEDKFEYREYFVGVRSFCFQKVLLDMFSAAHNGRKNVQNGEAADYFGSTVQFLPDNTGNANKLYKGVKNLPVFVASYDQCQQDFYSGNPCWVTNFLENVQDNNYFYPPDTVYNGLIAIKNQADEIRLSMSKGKNRMFDEAVLDQLIDAAKQAKDFCDGTINKKKQTTVCVLLSAMVLSYFAANGSTFMRLLDKEIKAPSHIGNIPVKKFAEQLVFAGIAPVDENIFCKTDSGTPLYNEILNNKKLFLAADGGFGKTVQLQHAAKKLTQLGNAAVYINLMECDQLSAQQQHLFLYNKIAAFSDSWSSSSPVDPHKSFCTLIGEQLNNEQIFVFIDGLNEISHKAKCITLSTIEKLEKLENLRLIVSCRYAEPALKHWENITLQKLDPLTLLCDEKLDVFSTLSDGEKDILSAPMFLQLFKESDSNIKPTVSNLLLYKVKRDMHRCSTLPEALGWIADFSNYMYCCKNKRLSFGLQELYEFFGERYKGVPFDEIVRNINVFLKQDAYGSFSYEHENYRDLFVAEHIRNSLVQSFDRGRTAAELFADNLYSDAVLLMLADMTDCAELLDNLRRNSFSGDWYSDSCAKATAVVYKTCILNKQQPPVYDLNLTKTHIRYLHHCDFSGCLVSDATFIKNNIETAVFSVLYDENRKTIYAVGKHSLHVFDEHLQPKETIAFAPENRRSYIACSAQNSKAVVFINACGEVFCFDKDKKDIKKLNADIGQKAYSVVSMGYNGAFIIGTAGGMFIFEKETLKYIALPENKPVFPLEKLGASIVYCTQKKVMLYANGSTRELWTLDNLCVKDKAVLCGQTIIKTLVLKSRNYILNFNRPGASVVAEVKIDGNFSVVAEPVFLTEAEETIPKERLQKSLHIDYYKINDMAYTQGTLLCACNSGFIRAISRNENGWKLDADRHFDLSSISNNPGECVESICMCGNRVVFGSTTRGLYLAENINDWRIIQYQGGQNNGIHKIIFSKDQNTLYAFLYNHGFIVLKRKNNKEPFRFADKISTVKSEKQEWCWAGAAVGDSSLYIASGSRLLCYAGNCLTEVHDFGEKIENLTAGTNVFRKKDTDVIFALYGHNISKIKITDGKIESKEEIKFESMKSRRTLSAAVNPFDRQLYCGFSDISEYTEYGINRCATVGCIPQNAKDNYMKSVIANHYGGWYRSIDFIMLKTDFLCICSGLQNNNNHVAVVYDSNFKEICTLEGHSSYVMDARFLNYDPLNNSVSAVTCGADGKINLYTFTLGESTVTHPLKTSPGEKDRLFNIIPDGKDLLVSSLDGNIYRWKNCCSSNDELQIEFSNNDIWITDSNFADIDCTSVFSLKKALESLNNIF